jgi:hypothetical protein
MVIATAAERTRSTTTVIPTEAERSGGTCGCSLLAMRQSPVTAESSTIGPQVADAQLSNPAVYMELWVDGKKRISYGSTHELRGTLTLTQGQHRLVYYAYDEAGNQLSKATYITVQ